MEGRHGAVTQHSQRAGQSAGVVALVLQTGPVQGEVAHQTVRLLLPPGVDHDAPPGDVLVQHHLLAPPGWPEGPDQAGVVEGAVSYLTPQPDLATLGAQSQPLNLTDLPHSVGEISTFKGDLFTEIHIKTLLALTKASGAFPPIYKSVLTYLEYLAQW